MTTSPEDVRRAWWKEAVVYQIYPRSFNDTDGDGVGDLSGVVEKVDYLDDLGVDCVWLNPVYESPNADNGYDIADYRAIMDEFGTMADWEALLERLHDHDMRLLMDLVVNHTSDEHPWFQEARRDPDSTYRDFYVWSEERPEGDDTVVFRGEQQEIWTYDEEAEAYYLHRFYKHQPDLNIANPAVREEICKIMGFWLELGISGFRVDAAPYMIELRGLEDEAAVEEPYEYLREFRDFLTWRRGDAILLAEANVPREKVREYFGDGTRMHMVFNFYLNQHLFLALARQQAAPILEGLRAVPQVPRDGQWANFLRNHDELNLSRLEEQEQEEVFAAFGPAEEMQIYGRGIRRRLLPMLGGDERRARMAYSLMLTLPGTPVLRYGQDIGMGDDLSLEERRSVRTVMQWSDEENAGFSDADPEHLVRPVIAGGDYGYERVNVERQRREDDSRLNWLERLLRLRKEHHELGWGDWEVIETGHPAVFAHLVRWRGSVMIAVHNLADEPAEADLALEGLPEGRMANLLGDRRYEPVEDHHLSLELEPYGYLWFHLRTRSQPPALHLGRAHHNGAGESQPSH